MESYTRMCMSATTPERSSLPSIGSVAANYGRTTEEEEKLEFFRYSQGSAMAESILTMHGMAAYEAFQEEMAEKREADAKGLARQQARQAARRAAREKCRCRLMAVVAKVMEKIGR